MLPTYRMIFISIYLIGQITIKLQLLWIHPCMFGLDAPQKWLNSTKQAKLAIISAQFRSVMRINLPLATVWDKSKCLMFVREKKSIISMDIVEGLVV